MSRKEVARNLVLEQAKVQRKVEIFLGTTLQGIPTEAKDASVIGMYCGNKEEANSILRFLTTAFAEKAIVKEIPVEPPKGGYLKALSVVLC